MSRFDYQQQYDEERRRFEEETYVPWLREQRLERERWYREFDAETNRIFKASREAWQKWSEQWR